jgi:hypothetical protein
MDPCFGSGHPHELTYPYSDAIWILPATVRLRKDQVSVLTVRSKQLTLHLVPKVRDLFVEMVPAWARIEAHTTKADLCGVIGF